MLRKACRWLALGTVLVLMTTTGGLTLLFFTTPNVDYLMQTDPQTTSLIKQAEAVGQQVTWIPVPYDAVSTDLKLAVVVAEDFRFFSHSGFDRYEIRAAMKDAVTGKRLRGASTITQQLARNLWLTQDRTVTRKLKEAMLAWKLERSLSKRRILELYLNTAIFGLETVGIEAAAQRYFDVPASRITKGEAAQLAASLPAPSHWYPGSKSPRAARHFQRILDRMDEAEGLRRLL